MQIGYMLETSFGSYDRKTPSSAEAMSLLADLLSEAKEAEAAGFRAIVVPERHMRNDCVVSDSLALLAAIAQNTSTIALGTYASVLTLHNPMEFAERVAFIDLLSGGRMFVTVARGFQSDYWRMLGLSPQNLTSRFLESVEILKLAWSGKPFTYKGKNFNYDDVFLTPLPCQRPYGPPIWGGGHSEAAIKRAADYASAWAGGFFPIDKTKWDSVVTEYRRLAQAGDKPGFVALVRAGFVAPTRVAAEREFGSLIMDEIVYYQHHPAIQPAYAKNLADISDMALDLVLGDPDDCITALRRYEEVFGVDFVIMRFRTPRGPSIQRSIEAIRLFGSHVLPIVQTPYAPKHAALPTGMRARDVEVSD